VTEKYEFIDAQYASSSGEENAPAITQMCGWLNVSPSGYYDWRSRPESDTAKRMKLLKIKIKALFYANDEAYGYRRVHAALVRGGEQAGDETVRKLMREPGLEPCQPGPWRHSLTRQGPSGPIPDLVNRDFTSSPRGQDGRRYNIYPDLGRMALSGDRHRLRDPEDNRLGNGR